MDRSTAKVLIILSTFVMLVLVVIFSLAQNKTAMIITFVVWAIGYIVLGYFLRCPNCGRWPGKHDFFDSYCPRCGEPLD